MDLSEGETGEKVREFACKGRSDGQSDRRDAPREEGCSAPIAVTQEDMDGITSDDLKEQFQRHEGLLENMSLSIGRLLSSINLIYSFISILTFLTRAY